MDNPEPRAQYLNVVLRQIERTALRIPRFQRHFVWGERDVLELLGSIEKGYPIGSILTWKVEASDDYFSGYRENPFPAADAGVNTFEVILDGAQRLSSLYGSLRNADAGSIYRVFYDLRDRAFVHITAPDPVQPWHVPMDSLFDSRRFLAAQSQIADLEDQAELLPRALDLYSTFQDYQVPIIALSNALLEDVVEVFRRVNSSGTPLSSVDFVRALTWRSGFDLEETFEIFAERYQATPLEGLTEEFLIRCLAIAAGLSLDARDVVQLKGLSARPGGLTAEVDAMERALDRMAELLNQIGVAGYREVPYEVQRLLLFALMHYSPDVGTERVINWFWRSTFAEEHQSKPESYTSRLIRELRDGRVEPTLEVRKPIDPVLLAERPRRGGSAVSIGFDLLLRMSGARSLLTGAPLNSSDAFHGLLFSRAELEAGIGSHVSNAGLLANIVLLDERDAIQWRTLRETAPLETLYEMCEAQTGDAEEIWRSQGLHSDLARPTISILWDRSATLLGSVIPDL